MEFQTIHVSRVATKQEADVMVGDTVPWREPTFTGPTVALDADTGELVAAHLPISTAAALRRAVIDLDYTRFSRAKHYASKSRTFGYSPRRPVFKREACQPTDTDLNHPDAKAALHATADECAAILESIAPQEVARDRQSTSVIRDEWRMGESRLWTSGIINDTSQLPYHRDGYNFPAYSAMPVLRRGMEGGHLHLPEYDMVIPCQDSYSAFFKGYQLVHGVTPFKQRKGARGKGYRYSVVFYTLQGMKDCHTAAEETRYGRRKRTEREREMARRLAAGERTIPGNKNHLAPNDKAEK